MSERLLEVQKIATEDREREEVTQRARSSRTERIASFWDLSHFRRMDSDRSTAETPYTVDEISEMLGTSGRDLLCGSSDSGGPF